MQKIITLLVLISVVFTSGNPEIPIKLTDLESCQQTCKSSVINCEQENCADYLSEKWTRESLVEHGSSQCEGFFREISGDNFNKANDLTTELARQYINGCIEPLKNQTQNQENQQVKDIVECHTDCVWNKYNSTSFREVVQNITEPLDIDYNLDFTHWNQTFEFLNNLTDKHDWSKWTDLFKGEDDDDEDSAASQLVNQLVSYVNQIFADNSTYDLSWAENLEWDNIDQFMNGTYNYSQFEEHSEKAKEAIENIIQCQDQCIKQEQQCQSECQSYAKMAQTPYALSVQNNSCSELIEQHTENNIIRKIDWNVTQLLSNTYQECLDQSIENEDDETYKSILQCQKICTSEVIEEYQELFEDGEVSGQILEYLGLMTLLITIIIY